MYNKHYIIKWAHADEDARPALLLPRRQLREGLNPQCTLSTGSHGTMLARIDTRQHRDMCRNNFQWAMKYALELGA